MMKLLLVVLSFSISLIVKSQNLTVKGTAPDLYVTHIVAPKENFYSVGRLYNQAPKSIAAFNNIAMEKGLTIGQQVKIPLNEQNLQSNGNTVASETYIPLTRIVAKNETLFKIGTDLHVPAQSLRKWNNLSSDNIAPGTPLIIGYLKTNNAQSSVSAVKNNTTPASNNNESVQKSMETTEAKQPATEAKKGSVSSDAGKQKKENQPETKSQEEGDQSVNETEKAAFDPSATIAGKDTALAVIPEDAKRPGNTSVAPVKEEPLKPQESEPVKSAESKITEQRTSKTENVNAGTFEDVYALQAAQKSENTKSGEAATFKSTSGWQDKKYYVLINDIAPGTILKISSSGNKAVYAKVLGSMPEMRENNGLLLRISNAAASDLGIIDPKFPVQVSYHQ